ncbi:hypothetical protein [Mucilaginibacter lappiensis]|uniref:Putative Holliday junction resolvase-like endonuclease n=1 Tax=Mucilaginibacter lappiensis TaxID=354630 RepID=A0A841JGW2_9SPHI|nr:hypothetical protein [Mucilaginibacter lappiensis]MBB6130399.1 putative Holliday junction resolvase-like endonuclease [Mucilaginibacter lappiensis]
MESSIVGALVVILITVLIFFVLRVLVLWYWKVDVIVDKLEAIASASQYTADDRRKQHRINYYIGIASKDNQLAYISLMNIIIDDILKPGLNETTRKELYNKNRERFQPVFDNLGYAFPEYELLF